MASNNDKDENSLIKDNKEETKKPIKGKGKGKGDDNEIENKLKSGKDTAVTASNVSQVGGKGKGRGKNDKNLSEQNENSGKGRGKGKRGKAEEQPVGNQNNKTKGIGKKIDDKGKSQTTQKRRNLRSNETEVIVVLGDSEPENILDDDVKTDEEAKEGVRRLRGREIKNKSNIDGAKSNKSEEIKTVILEDEDDQSPEEQKGILKKSEEPSDNKRITRRTNKGK